MVDMKLEVVVVPVTDVDRAGQFYERLGFRLDVDYSAGDNFRVLQLTPPGSAASIIVGKGVTIAAPGSLQGLQMVVTDIAEACVDLAGRGVEISDVFHDVGGVFYHAGTYGRLPGLHPERADYGSFASFCDPDGNGWVLQEVVKRAPGR